MHDPPHRLPAGAARGRPHHLLQGGGAQRGGGPAPERQGARHHLRGPALRHPPQADGGLPGGKDEVYRVHRRHRHGAEPAHPAGHLHGHGEVRRGGAPPPEAGGDPADRRPGGPVRHVFQGVCGGHPEPGADPGRAGGGGPASAVRGGGLLRPGAPGGLRPAGGPDPVEPDAHGGALPQAGHHPVHRHHLQDAGDGVPALQGAGAAGGQHPL